MIFQKKGGMDTGSRIFLTFVILVFHGPWIMHWVIWKILIVRAVTPSILIRLSKFLCWNILAFQDLSFSFIDQPRGNAMSWHVPTWPEMCPKVGPWKTKITKIKKNPTSRARSSCFLKKIISPYPKKNWKKWKHFLPTLSFWLLKVPCQALLLIANYQLIIETSRVCHFFSGYLSGHFEVFWAKIR